MVRIRQNRHEFIAELYIVSLSFSCSTLLLVKIKIKNGTVKPIYYFKLITF